MRKTKLIICIVLIVLLFSSQWAWPGDDKIRRILLLDSYSRNVVPCSTVASIFRMELNLLSPELIDLHEVSLESARFAHPENEVPFINFLKERLSRWPPDLVVSIGGPAFSFLSRHRNTLFEEKPLMIAAVAHQVLRDMGSLAIRVALRILQGESLVGLVIASRAPQEPVYDWRVLQRWGIPESRLPKSSAVYFLKPSYWDLYRWQITGVVLLVLFQSFLIARLMIQMRRRNHAERQLFRSEKRLRLFTNALPVLIAYVDSDQRYQFNNDAYKAWFGISPEQAPGIKTLISSY